MVKKFAACRMVLRSGLYSYYPGIRLGRDNEVGAFDSREEAVAKCAELNRLPGHGAVPPADGSRCGFCGGPTPCLRQD